MVVVCGCVWIVARSYNIEKGDHLRTPKKRTTLAHTAQSNDDTKDLDENAPPSTHWRVGGKTTENDVRRSHTCPSLLTYM
jgi:hypothetical protein